MNAPGRPIVASILDAKTKPNDVVAICGLDWSGELPYQVHRRALMAWELHGDSVVNDSIRKEGADRIVAVVIYADDRAKSDAILANLVKMGFYSPQELSAEDCNIYLH